MAFNYYSINDPIIGDNILVKFTSQNDAFLGSVIEFKDYRCIMNFHDVVKKKKVISWNKYVPLNKLLVVQVEDVDSTKKIVQVSMAYLFDKFKDLTYSQIQDKLMIHFNENIIMENFINSLCIIHKYDYQTIWTSLVHHFDHIKRSEHNDSSLWKYFSDNFHDIDVWLQNTNLIHISQNIKDLYSKRTFETPKKITTKVGIISLNGISYTKNFLLHCFSLIDFEYKFKYDSTPFYILETFNNNTTVDSHSQFVKILESESSKFPKLFIKFDYIAKII